MWFRHLHTAVEPHRSAELEILKGQSEQGSVLGLVEGVGLSWSVGLYIYQCLPCLLFPCLSSHSNCILHLLFRSTHYVHVPSPLRLSVIANCHTLLFYMAQLKRCWLFEKVYSPPLTIRRRFPALDQRARLVSSKKKKSSPFANRMDFTERPKNEFSIRGLV